MNYGLKESQLLKEFPLIWLNQSKLLSADIQFFFHLKYSLCCRFCRPLDSATRGTGPLVPNRTYAPVHQPLPSFKVSEHSALQIVSDAMEAPYSFLSVNPLFQPHILLARGKTSLRDYYDICVPLEK